MSERDDKLSDFERIFGRQNAGTKPLPDPAAPGVTQKTPSDSDLLGLRTDSDRFIVKSMPEPPEGDANPLPSTEDSSSNTGDPKAQPANEDAVTIALNVNVFANLRKNEKGEDAKKDSESDDILHRLLNRLPSSNASGAVSDGQVFMRPLSDDPASPASSPGDTEFTRVLQIQDSVKVSKSSLPKEENLTGSTAIASSLSPKATEMPPGASEFTRVVKGSDLRNLQEKLAAAAPVQPASWPSAAPGDSPTVPPANAWQSPAPQMPQYVPSPNVWPGPNPAAAQLPAQKPSKLAQYMPLIVLLNLLFLIAVLLIVLFAIKK